jgi:hypothetical protein
MHFSSLTAMQHALSPVPRENFWARPGEIPIQEVGAANSRLLEKQQGAVCLIRLEGKSLGPWL